MRHMNSIDSIYYQLKYLGQMHHLNQLHETWTGWKQHKLHGFKVFLQEEVFITR